MSVDCGALLLEINLHRGLSRSDVIFALGKCLSSLSFDFLKGLVQHKVAQVSFNQLLDHITIQLLGLAFCKVDCEALSRCLVALLVTGSLEAKFDVCPDF